MSRRAAMWQACLHRTRGAVVAVAASCAFIAFAAGSATAADMSKTLRVAFPVAETGFDPQATSDLYSNYVQRAVFESLYGFEYLTRPYKMGTLTAAAMPDIADGGRTWTMRVKPGIYFADDPAFKGRKRELTAEDYVYSWKRLLDPRMRSPYAWFLAGKIAGADDVLAAAQKNGRLDYDATMEGLRALDRYTLRLKLKDPDYLMLGYMSQSAMAAVAREVIEAYGDGSGWAMANPVGTGPYRLKQWRRGQQILLEANPDFRAVDYPKIVDSEDRKALAVLSNRKLPMVGNVEISIIEESNPRLLAFNSGTLDYLTVPSDLANNVLDAGGKLKPEYVSRGVSLTRITQPSLQYAYFNMEDPVVGGYSKDKIALRRAIVMGFNTPDYIHVAWQDQALPATQPIPPNVPGHDPNWSVRVKYDVTAAKGLLDRFGYVDKDGDGWRDLPDGKPLVLTMGSDTSGRARDIDEAWAKSMKAIGIRIDFVKQKWPDLLKMGRAGQLQMWRVGWITTYAEGDAFAQLLYSKNIGQTNYSRFALPEYDELYRASRQIPDGPQRNAMYHKMSELVAAYNPWELGVYTIENTVIAPWVKGYKKHAYVEHPWMYLDVDNARQASAH